MKGLVHAFPSVRGTAEGGGELRGGKKDFIAYGKGTIGAVRHWVALIEDGKDSIEGGLGIVVGKGEFAFPDGFRIGSEGDFDISHDGKPQTSGDV